MLTLLRLVAHAVVGVLMGLLYWRTGDDASAVYNNAGLLFFNQLFLLFTAMMPTVLTCALRCPIGTVAGSPSFTLPLNRFHCPQFRWSAKCSSENTPTDGTRSRATTWPRPRPTYRSRCAKPRFFDCTGFDPP